MAIDAVIPLVIPVVVGDTEGLGILSIDTVEVVDATTDVKAAAGINGILCVQPALMQVKAISVLIEASGPIVAVVTKLGPTTDVKTTDVIKQFEGVAQAALAGIEVQPQSHAVAASVTARGVASIF